MAGITIRDIGILFGYEVDRASEDRVESSVKGLKDMASKALGAIGLTLSISGISAAISDCVSLASEVEEMENKFNVVFGEISGEVDAWAQNYADAIGRNKNDIKTYLADQQNLLVGFGMTREEGSKLAEQMTTLALDLASFGNLDETYAVENMQKAVMGESEAAKGLGAVLNDVTRAQAMRDLGLTGSYEKLDQLAKMQVNYQAILGSSVVCVGGLAAARKSRAEIGAREHNHSNHISYVAKTVGHTNHQLDFIIGSLGASIGQSVFGSGNDSIKMTLDFLAQFPEHRYPAPLRPSHPFSESIGDVIRPGLQCQTQIFLE